MENASSSKRKVSVVTHVLSSTRTELKVKVERRETQSFPWHGAAKISRVRTT